MKDIEEKEQPKEVQKFYWPGTDKRIHVTKRKERMWRNCHRIRSASWIMIPLLFFLGLPKILVLWIIAHIIATVKLGEEEIVNAQKKGSEYSPSFSGGFGGLFGDDFF